jgi:hypothetical protein
MVAFQPFRLLHFGVPNSVNKGFKDVTEVEIFVNRISREPTSQPCLESRAAAGALGGEGWEK